MSEKVKKQINIQVDLEMPVGEEAHLAVLDTLKFFITEDLQHLVFDMQGVLIHPKSHIISLKDVK